MPETITHHYVDTDYLLPYLFYGNRELKSLLAKDKRVEKEKRETLKKCFFSRNTNIFYKIPLIVIGEVYNKFKSNIDFFTSTAAITHMNDEINKLCNRYNVDFVPPNNECFRTAWKLSDISNRDYLGPTDALIVSQALYDKNSKKIYTQDRAIINSLINGLVCKSNKDLYENGSRLALLGVDKSHL